MLHQYYRNLSNKIFAGVLFTLAFSYPTYADGLFNNLKTISKTQKDTFDNLLKTFQNINFKEDEVNNIKEVYLNTIFLNSISFNTPNRYMNLATMDSCSIYDLMLSGLLKTPSGELSSIIFDYKTKKDEIKTAALPLRLFKEKIIQAQCPNSLKLWSYFQEPNLRATIKNLKLTRPKAANDCAENLNEHNKNPFMPYLCMMSEKINDIPKNSTRLKNLALSKYKERSIIQKELDIAKTYSLILNDPTKNYLNNLCRYLDQPEKFCDNHFQESFWNKAKQLKQEDYLSSFCGNSNQLNKCIQKLNTNNQACYFSENNKYMSMTPRPGCEEVSNAFSHSRLYSNYKDCPANIGNENLVTWARILNHFKPMDFLKTESCDLNSIYSVLLFNKDYTDFEQWKSEICFEDKIARQTTCYPTFYNDLSFESEYSLSRVVGKIANRLKGYNTNFKPCKITTNSEYKPTLLEFKSGCIIIKDETTCKGTNCDLKVLIDEVPFNNFTIKNKIDFKILPTEFTKENKSYKNIFELNEKKTFKRILNISTFLNTYKEKPNAIFYGQGCAEVLLPTYFKERYINACTPINFIIDGYKEFNSQYAMIVRTSLDHLHAPRMISWNYVYSAIKQYQNLHPINTWGFYAIY